MKTVRELQKDRQEADPQDAGNVQVKRYLAQVVVAYRLPRQLAFSNF
jgi:hypothetical protein